MIKPLVAVFELYILVMGVLSVLATTPIVWAASPSIYLGIVMVVHHIYDRSHKSCYHPWNHKPAEKTRSIMTTISERRPLSKAPQGYDPHPIL